MIVLTMLIDNSYIQFNILNNLCTTRPSIVHLYVCKGNFLATTHYIEYLLSKCCNRYFCI